MLWGSSGHKELYFLFKQNFEIFIYKIITVFEIKQFTEQLVLSRYIHMLLL